MHIISENNESNPRDPKKDKDKVVDSLSFSILKQKDYTTALTRKLNRQPRIYANKIDLDDDVTETFLFPKAKTKEDIFQESQERVFQHIETIIQSQNDTFNDSFREIDEMSQENEEHLERIEKYLEKLKAKIMKKRIKSQNPIKDQSNESKKQKKKKECPRNQRADSLLQLNISQLK